MEAGVEEIEEIEEEDDEEEEEELLEDRTNVFLEIAPPSILPSSTDNDDGKEDFDLFLGLEAALVTPVEPCASCANILWFSIKKLLRS